MSESGKGPDLKSGEAERCGGSNPPPSAIDIARIIAIILLPERADFFIFYRANPDIILTFYFGCKI